MKKRKFIPLAGVVLCFGIMLLLSSSACGDTKENMGWPKSKKKKIEMVSYDTIVAQRLTDTIARVLFSSNHATMYRINPAVNPKDNDKTIGGIKVEETIGEMTLMDIQKLKFLLSDSCCFNDSPVIPLTPFSPSIALEMNNDKEVVYLLFSFVSQEVGFVIDGEMKRVHRYSYARLITRLFQNGMDKEYYNYLMELIK